MSESNIERILKSPEMQDVRKAGFDAEEAELIRLLQLSESALEQESILALLETLFFLYVTHDHRDDAISIASRILMLEDVPPQLLRMVAQTLFLHCDENNLALKLIERQISEIPTIFNQLFEINELLRCKRLQLAIIARSDPHSERASVLVDEIALCLQSFIVYDDFFVDSLQVMVSLGHLRKNHSIILEVIWSDLMRIKEFDGHTYQSQLDMVNTLAKQLNEKKRKS